MLFGKCWEKVAKQASQREQNDSGERKKETCPYWLLRYSYQNRPTAVSTGIIVEYSLSVAMETAESEYCLSQNQGKDRKAGVLSHPERHLYFFTPHKHKARTPLVEVTLHLLIASLSCQS